MRRRISERKLRQYLLVVRGGKEEDEEGFEDRSRNDINMIENAGRVELGRRG